MAEIAINTSLPCHVFSILHVFLRAQTANIRFIADTILVFYVPIRINQDNQISVEFIMTLFLDQYRGSFYACHVEDRPPTRIAQS